MESLDQRMRDKAGQAGQAGQGGQQGSPSGSDANGMAGGSPSGGGYGGSDARNWGGAGGSYSPDDVRQFRNELREWQASAESLRRELTQAGVDARDLDAVLRDMRSLNSDRNFVDPRSLQALHAAALDRLKQFEFGLRREAEGGNQPLSLSASDEVPAGFRTAIEEYYRSLARRSAR
jgi:hypothetical protein